MSEHRGGQTRILILQFKALALHNHELGYCIESQCSHRRNSRMLCSIFQTNAHHSCNCTPTNIYRVTSPQKRKSTPKSETAQNTSFHALIPAKTETQACCYDIVFLYRPCRMDFLFVGVSESCRFVGLLKAVACLTKNAHAWNVPIRRNMLGFVQPCYRKG
jgi:hypothetical protein